MSVIECLVACLILAIVALGVAIGTTNAASFSNRAIREGIANELAQARLEALAAINPDNLDAGDGGSEALVVDNISFTRDSTVTVNADDSVTITVAVTSSNVASHGGSATLSTVVVPWGNE